MQNNIIINNQLISYYFFNEKAEKTLVFLHGWRSQGLIWEDVASELSGRNKGVAIYLLDLPGFGNSPAPKNSFFIQDYANIVAEFIKKLKLNDVILIGHSFGGRIAIKLSAQNQQAIKKLVLVDSAGLIASAKTKKGVKFLAKIVKPFFKPKFMQGLRTKLYQKIGAEDYIATPYLKETFLNIANENLIDCLSYISQPTLIIWGENDKDTPLIMAKTMQEKIKNSRLIILENAGHFSFLGKPDDFRSLLEDFIKQ
ncbi:MAG: alpha/beta hydrolase [Patescibacteria group bacterium]|nr:alpha/beta hydrolase [Patescibacteria group bacterium]